MTPLAQRITKQLTLPVKDREPFWRDNSELVRQAMAEVHCFETTEVVPLLEVLRDVSQDYFGERCFLPAPKTWIEWRHPLGRVALLLEEVGQGRARATAFWDDLCCEIGSVSTRSDDYYARSGQLWVPTPWAEAYGHEGLTVGLLSAAHFMLVMINTPKVVGRRTHAPHRGLERALLKARQMVGKFPLLAWTEIKLEITPPHDASGEMPTEGRLTGSKALHFCRAHLRVRLGRLEMVRSHWRGDPALGIKQSRYKLTPGRAA